MDRNDVIGVHDGDGRVIPPEDIETERGWVRPSPTSAAAFDTVRVRSTEARVWRDRFQLLHHALERTGHYASRTDHHAQVCPLCTALRAAQEVTGGNTGHRPAGQGRGSADQEQRERAT